MENNHIRIRWQADLVTSNRKINETITIQQAQAEIAKLESQQKADEALITTADTKAQRALNLAQTNEQGIAKLDSEIIEKVDKIPKGLKYRVYAIEDIAGAPLNFLEVTGTPLIGQIPNYSNDGTLKGNEAKADDDYVNFAQFKTEKSKIIKLHKDDINDGVKDKGVAGIFFAKDDYAPTFQTVLKQKTGEYYVKMPLPIIKTLFGKSIMGTGNIDLYKHHIKLEFTTADSNSVYFDFISSKNTVCDSLEDLKTVLGNEFTIPAYGSVFGVFDETSTLFIAEYLLINSSEAFLQTYYSGTSDFNAKSISLALNPFTLSDNVTTI